jgi:hypothetical protein
MNNLFPLLSGITLVIGGSILITYSLYQQWQSSLFDKPFNPTLANDFKDL